MTDRREFLKKLAKGAVYAAPVVYTMSTPKHVHAIITSGMIMIFMSQRASDQTPGPAAPWEQSNLPKSPWEAPSPWDQQPPKAPGGGGGE